MKALREEISNKMKLAWYKERNLFHSDSLCCCSMPFVVLLNVCAIIYSLGQSLNMMHIHFIQKKKKNYQNKKMVKKTKRRNIQSWEWSDKCYRYSVSGYERVGVPNFVSHSNFEPQWKLKQICFHILSSILM